MAGSLHLAPPQKNNDKMSDVEMVEAGTDDTQDETSGGKSQVLPVSGSSKSIDVVPKAYELPWLASKSSVMPTSSTKYRKGPNGATIMTCQIPQGTTQPDRHTPPGRRQEAGKPAGGMHHHAR